MCTLYDVNGNVIKPPICEKCNGFKSPLIGKYASTWICMGKCNYPKINDVRFEYKGNAYE